MIEAKVTVYETSVATAMEVPEKCIFIIFLCIKLVYNKAPTFKVKVPISITCILREII